MLDLCFNFLGQRLVCFDRIDQTLVGFEYLDQFLVCFDFNDPTKKFDFVRPSSGMFRLSRPKFDSFKKFVCLTPHRHIDGFQVFRPKTDIF